MPRRVGCDVSAFDGRERKKKREQNEWMNVNPIRTMSIFFLSLSLSFFLFFSFALLHPIGRSYLSVLFFFSHLLRSFAWEWKWRCVSFLFFFASSCSHLKAKNFLLLFFIHVIYMRALKDDARFDLFLTLYCLYAWKKKFI